MSLLRMGLLLCSAGLTVCSAAAREIAGTVVDNEGAPLDFANVILMRDSVFATGAVTDSIGAFHFDAVPDGANALRVSMAGYEDHIRSLATSDSLLPAITLQPAARLLGEVTVRSTLPVTRLSGSSMITTVAGSVLADAGTADDVIAKLPLVTGSDGSFSVFGSGAPVIYINGRQVRDSSELRQLSSDNILSAEVITNPGSRYGADVKAVIRIRTRKVSGDGFGIDLWSQNSVARYFSTTDMINAKYRTGGLDIFAMVYGRSSKAHRGQQVEQTTYAADTWTQLMSSDGIYRSRSIFGKLGLNWQINDRHSVGAFWQLGETDSPSATTLSSDIYRNGNPDGSWSSTGSYQSRNRPQNSANIYYNGAVGKLEIDFNADYLSNKLSEDNRDQEHTSAGTDDVISANTSRGRLIAEKLVLSYPVGKGSLELGQEYTNTRSDYDYSYTGLDITSSYSSIHESNAAVFAEIGQQFGPIHASAGLRYEHARNRSRKDGILMPDQSRTYDNLFPSASVSARAGQVQLALSFTSKTRRPAYSELDGNLRYVNRMTYQQGNPYLRPTKIYTLQLQSSWRWLFMEASFTRSNDAVFNTTLPFDDDPTARLITYTNVPRYSTLSVAVGAQPRIGCWSPSLTAGIDKQWYTGIYRGADREFATPVGYVQFNNWISLPRGWRLSGDFMFKSGGSRENGSFRPVNSLDMSVYKSFLNQSLSVWLKVSDILDGSHSRGTMYVGDYRIALDNSGDSRTLSLTLRYRFNSSRDKYKGTGAGQAEKERL